LPLNQHCTTMKTPISLVFILFLLAGCASEKNKVYTTEIGMYTPYALFPEHLNGRVKKLVEKTYKTRELNGGIVADAPLTLSDRDSIEWTLDFIATFNKDGLLIQCDEIDENNKVLSSNKTTFRNRKIVKVDYFKNDSFVNYQKIYFNPEGRIEKFEVFSSNDSLLYFVDVKSDETGNMLSLVITNSQSQSPTRYDLTYNNRNQRTGYKYFNSEGEKTFEQQFFYNDHGFMEKQLMINQSGDETVSVYSFSYDENKNWIECIGDDGEAKLLTKREIEYFE